MVTKADKGNTMITYKIDHNRKINNFINNNNFIQDANNVTNRLQRDIRNTINECHYLIPKEDRWKYVNMNRTAPTIRSLIKIHMAEVPIRPIINWKNAPAHKIAKALTFKNRASYIQDGRTATLQMLHFIHIFLTDISTEYFKHAAHSPFFSSKCRLFRNATFFVFLYYLHFTYRVY
jgi:hypothetical protein